ncbi:ABC transporter ATP-binding protein [Nitrospira sp. BLG_2]|uniref:ABC transporter ATP-binding protein n=1 Tax=Nitrospira sp. BLG_2 TaxID=3397507 RepID=UPI003B9D85D8
MSKKFRLFASPKERLLEALHPFRKRYHHEFWALRDVSFEVKRGESIGILGRNGSGKSTLLQIICAVMQATSGEVQVNGRVSALLELGAGFNPEFTGRDNIILNGAIMGFSRKEMLRRLPEIEAFADIGEFFDQPVKTYSSGMFARVAFASAIHVDPDVLVVDEILGVGDAKFQEKCYSRIRAMRNKGTCILFVSHSTEAIQRNCNTALLLDSGKIVARDSVDAVIAAYHDLLYGSGLTGECETTVMPTEQKIAVCSNESNQISKIEFQEFLEGGSNGPVYKKFQYYNSHERRLGNREAEIVDFLVTIDGYADFNVLSGNEEIKIYLKVRFTREIGRPELGWAIVSPEGIVITGSNTAMSEIPLPEARPGETWVYAVSMQPALCGGDYFINFGIGEIINGTWTFLDNRRAAAHLSVAHRGKSTGFFDLSFKCEVISSPKHHE